MFFPEDIMIRRFFTIALMAMMLVPACQHNNGTGLMEPPQLSIRQLTPGEQKLITSDNLFSFKIFREINDQQLTSEEADANIFISPISISMALGMTYNGAGGTTKQAMETVLEFSGLNLDEINESYKSLIELLTGLDENVLMGIANALWYRFGLPVKTGFLDNNRRYFDAEIDSVNFGDPQTLQIINDWVSDKTEGKIDKILDQLHPATVMVLVNAIYFKAAWQETFDTQNTHDGQFTLQDGATTTVRMMRRKGDVRHLDNETVQAVDLPYGDGYYSMTLVMPQQNTDIDAFIAGLDNDTWNNWMSSFTEVEDMILTMPKFKFKYKLKLNDVLIALGMEEAFYPGADFSNIVTGSGIWIDKVLHKSFIDVNEEGTEAAAATAVVMLKSLQDTITFNRPFFFVIRENQTGAIVFMGKVLNPVYE